MLINIKIDKSDTRNLIEKRNQPKTKLFLTVLKLITLKGARKYMLNTPTSKFKTLKTKILALVTLALLIIGVISVSSNIMLSSQINRYQKLIEVENTAASQISVINLQFKTQVQEWKNVLLRGHQVEDREKYWAKFVQQHQLVQQLATDILSLNVFLNKYNSTTRIKGKEK